MMVVVLNRIAIFSVAATIYRATIAAIHFLQIIYTAKHNLRYTGNKSGHESNKGSGYRHDGIEKRPGNGDGIDSGFRGGYEESGGSSLARSQFTQ